MMLIVYIENRLMIEYNFKQIKHGINTTEDI